MGSREVRRKLLSEVFEVCVTLREIKVARNDLHSKSLMVSPPTTKEHHLGCSDPLMHFLVDLNHQLAALKRECINQGIEEGVVDKIIKFWGLK